jgi:HD-like signal output (HDOD) protein
MSADRNNHKIRLVSASQQFPVDSTRSSTFPLPGEAEFPGPPAMPNALLRLELCLSAPVVDLQDIANIVRSDVGLTVQLLRLAARETEPSPGMISPASEIAIQVGVDGLKELAAQTKPLPDHLRSHAGLSACERVWTHSRLTALIAEDLTGQCSEVSSEEAYLAGLLHHVGDLPSILGWANAGSGPADFHPIGYRMAKAWELPDALADVIGGNREVCSTRKSHALLDIVETADNWAARLESLAAREATRIGCSAV